MQSPTRGLVEIDHVAIDFPGKDGPTRALTSTALRLEPGTFTAIIGRVSASGRGSSMVSTAVFATLFTA